eukprot:CAMPEP_0115393978 /NCGR_PEP_ID=MMETSP0271-20121206/12028_1 /TAXON_ID=71861 /ORGANISM="Scrippsiella trochoidea, Strain CCMP3099" /LENGTH=531 /DNA_ID=CAMNT_0002817633 /DNA_START=47 /DNA_END=1638 /DNA_ORIENTATION=+
MNKAFGGSGSPSSLSLAMALPSALLAVLIQYAIRELKLPKQENNLGISQVWHGYNFVVGFLLAFRTNKAYSRWWEGGTLLQQARGEWFNAYSSLLAFCSDKKDVHKEVEVFQQTLVRLMSMLYCAALEQISSHENAEYEVIDPTVLEPESLEFLRYSTDKVEIILQWIQRLVVENMHTGVLPVPPPVITRVFQELSRGIVNLNNVRKIAEFLFPFPYAQMIAILLLIQSVLTPIIAAFLLEDNELIAAAIEIPFGEDSNDLPMSDMMAYMNRTLIELLKTQAQEPPRFMASVPSKRQKYKHGGFGPRIKLRTVPSQVLSRPVELDNRISTQSEISEASKIRRSSTRSRKSALIPGAKRKRAIFVSVLLRHSEEEASSGSDSENVDEFPGAHASSAPLVHQAACTNDATDTFNFEGVAADTKAGFPTLLEPQQHQQPHSQRALVSDEQDAMALQDGSRCLQQDLKVIDERMKELQGCLRLNMEQFHMQLTEELGLISSLGDHLMGTAVVHMQQQQQQHNQTQEQQQQRQKQR